MDFKEEEGKVIVETPAKLNLFLEVIRKRADGYHDIETIMQEVGLWDCLEIEKRDGGIEVESRGEGVPSGRENIAFRAAQILFQEKEIKGGGRISIEKRIPTGSGLGGGSGNAAGVIAGLNWLYSLGLTREEMANIGGKVGSDVPFFFYGGTCLCLGRGEIVVPQKGIGGMTFLLLIPQKEILSRLIYENLTFSLTKKRQNSKILLKRLYNGELTRIGECFFNRLEEPVKGVCPEVYAIKKRVERLVGKPFSMTGSGSGLFCFFEKKREAVEQEGRLRDIGFQKTYLVESISRD